MKKVIAMFLTFLMALGLAGCQFGYSEGSVDIDKLSEKDADETLASWLTEMNIAYNDPPIDLDTSTKYVEEMPDINAAFPLSVEGGSAQVNIEIWVSTERSGTGNEGWVNRVTEKINASRPKLSDGRTVSYSIRSMDSGTQLDYLTMTDIRPDAWSVSNELWDVMATSRGINSVMVLKRSAGNTAGILMNGDTYKAYMERHNGLDLAELARDVIDGKEVLGFTNPYRSGTTLNMLTEILNALSPGNPLSQEAEDKFLELQKFAPPPAHTTAQMRESAKKGFINVMTMECQAYSNEVTLNDYVFTPLGVRHDNPVYAFTDTPTDRREAIDIWCQYITNDESQKLATQMGFNQHDEYKGSSLSLTGSELHSAQSLWKKNKSGGKPTVAVFVADVSGSMSGSPMNNLKDSLLNSMQYIGEDSEIGFVSFSNKVTVELPIGRFQGTQRAKFQGAVKNLNANGSTHMYSGITAAIDMIQKHKKDTGMDANYMIFVLSDGETDGGVREDVCAQLIVSYDIPVHTIGYGGEINSLKNLAKYTEGFSIWVSTDDVIYNMKNMFNSQM